MNEINYEEVPIEVPKEEKLNALAVLATKQAFTETQLKLAKDKVEELEHTLAYLSEKQIPDLMLEIGMSEFTLTNGVKIKVMPFYSATIDDTNRDACMKWLNENGHGAIIKKMLTFDFGKTDGINWLELIPMLQHLINEKYSEIDLVPDIETEFKEGVHHQTLKAFLKEQLTAGKDIPLATFKAFVGKKTKITF